MTNDSPFILPLDTSEAQLETVGGKGANLSKLANAGFPVPDGFLVTTWAYQQFVQSNQLANRIYERLDGVDMESMDALQAASREIRAWFAQGKLSPTFTSNLLETYAAMGSPPVAVRSSATAEDLPEMSFAGQQDTFLNVVGGEGLLRAVVFCWSSLWTARAIGYRARNNIPQYRVALSVVVQEMVDSEVSGVMFTANPLTGHRGETLIEATFGLGEALVGGHVEPDSYKVNTRTGQTIEKILGRKGVSIRSTAGGGVEKVDEDAADQQALPDSVILALADLGKKVTKTYDFPQDIEWAWADDNLFLLQSRPITSLYPAFDDLPAYPPRITFSFASVQGIMEPITPLGQDTVKLLFAGAAEVLGFHGLTHETMEILYTAGERLYVDFTTIFQGKPSVKLVPRFFSGVDPGVVLAYEQLKKDPSLQIGTKRLMFKAIHRAGKFIVPAWVSSIPHWHHPEGKGTEIMAGANQEIARIQAIADQLPHDPTDIAPRLALYRETRGGLRFAVRYVMSRAIVGLLPMAIIAKLASRIPGQETAALEITRGLPNNVTTEMDLALWETARVIGEEPAARAAFGAETPESLGQMYFEGQLPGEAQAVVSAFMKRFGMRGLGEIDIGRPRWREQPASVMEVLQSYLQIDDPEMAPDAVFQRGEQAAQAALENLVEAARETRFGWLKARMIRFLYRRLREFAGLREAPKFHVIQVFGIVREALLESGVAFVDAGVLEKPNDLFYMKINELEALANGETTCWKELVRTRRENYRRELRRKQLPRILLSDGRAFYEGLSAGDRPDGGMHGSPVSPGVVDGTVRVVHSPQNANLQPGEIMVCVGTDPAWTPLFLAASGLVMEVGGLMTHGSIVAREYGIPAVVGVHQVTERLKTGQRIRVNGTTGEIEILA